MGSSLGGMCSIAMGAFYPHMVGRLVSLSAASKAHPTAIAFRYLQRRCIMEDPNWNKGHYYDGKYPLRGTKLARWVCVHCCFRKTVTSNTVAFAESWPHSPTEVGLNGRGGSVAADSRMSPHLCVTILRSSNISSTRDFSMRRNSTLTPCFTCPRYEICKFEPQQSIFVIVK